ncbi:hypothetical protein [Nocardia sp. NPDC051463]|uniref:MmyB family transcriptional regulator n=1 Tax=Nocardia sp. NPDC051463 TaxID=3154845 RepID=UPI00343F2A3F
MLGGRIRLELIRVLDLIADGPRSSVDHRLDVAAANPLALMLYSRPMQGLNIARYIFLDEDGRTLFAGWETCTRDTVGQLRPGAGKYPDKPQLTSLIDELAVHRDRFRKLWAHTDVRSRAPGSKAYVHPLVGDLELHQETSRCRTKPEPSWSSSRPRPGVPRMRVCGGWRAGRNERPADARQDLWSARANGVVGHP